MRILVFHGYLLGGTGSNVYNARLAAALVAQGHEVHLFSQDRDAERQTFVDAVGDWDAGTLRLRDVRERDGGRTGVDASTAPTSATCFRSMWPIATRAFAAPFLECSDAEIARYLAANVAAVRELAEGVSPDVALANHPVMGPVILARAVAGRVPYAVKVHGSALEYSSRPNPSAFRRSPARASRGERRAGGLPSHGGEPVGGT